MISKVQRGTIVAVGRFHCMYCCIGPDRWVEINVTWKAINPYIGIAGMAISQNKYQPKWPVTFFLSAKYKITGQEEMKLKKD